MKLRIKMEMDKKSRSERFWRKKEPELVTYMEDEQINECKVRIRLRVSVGAGGSEIRGGWKEMKEPPQVQEPTCSRVTLAWQQPRWPGCGWRPWVYRELVIDTTKRHKDSKQPQYSHKGLGQEQEGEEWGRMARILSANRAKWSMTLLPQISVFKK